MKIILTVVLPFIFLLAGCAAKQAQVFKTNSDLRHKIDKNFIDATAQYKMMMKQLPPDRFPKTYHPTTARFETSNSAWWCSGFYPGTLLYV